MESIRQDLRAAFRGFARNRGFTAAVVLTMALGIGANSAIFSVVHGVLLSPLPYTRGDDLLILRQQRPLAGITSQGFSPLELADYRQQSKTFESIVEYHNMWFVLLGRGEPERVQTGRRLLELLRPLRREAGRRQDVPRSGRTDRRRCRAPAEQQLLAQPVRRRSPRRGTGLRDERSPAHGRGRAAGDSTVSRRERRLHAGLGVPVPLVGARPRGSQRADGPGVRPAPRRPVARRVEIGSRDGGVEPPAGLSGELSRQRGLHGDGPVAARRADARVPAHAGHPARRRRAFSC